MGWRERFAEWLEGIMPWFDAEKMRQREAHTEQVRVDSIAVRVDAEKKRSRGEAIVRIYQQGNHVMSKKR